MSMVRCYPTHRNGNSELGNVTNKGLIASNDLSSPNQIDFYMKRIFLLLASLCTIHFSFAQSDKLDALIDAYAKLYKFNGAALVAKNGTILLNKGYGYRNAEDKVANNEQTIFQLG